MKPLAVFTMVRNEAVFLPLWLRHYNRTGADLHVLDHESNDGSVNPDKTPIPFSVRRVVHPTTDDAGWMLTLVQDTQRELLREYRRVIYAEVDEILVPVGGDLRGWLDRERRADATVTATGYDVCPLPDSPPLIAAWTKTACEQHTPGRFELECPACNSKNATPLVNAHPLRGRALKRNDRYDKTLISSEPLTWEVGFHRTTGRPPQAPDPHLLLLHFHYADRELAWKRLQTRMRDKPPSPGDLGFQNKYRDREPFDRNFDEAVRDAVPTSTALGELLL